MDRRAVAVVAGLSIVIVAAAAGVLLKGPPRVHLSDSPTDADRVTLYQSGLAFVELTRTFDTGGGQAVLVFSVPSSTVFDSVSIEADGVDVLDVRSTLSSSPLIQPGDDVVVHARDGATFEGTVVSFASGGIVLASGGDTTMVSPEHIVAVDIVDGAADTADPGVVEVGALVDAVEGSHEVRLSYLARGAGWTPNYHLDVATGGLEFFATLTGLQDWQNITLDIVSGSPRVVASGGGPTPVPAFEFDKSVSDTSAAGLGADGSGGFGASTPLGELHRYSLGRKVDLYRGETVRLPVLVGDVDLSRHYFSVEGFTGWGGASGDDRRVDVLERYTLRNTLDEPLPPGVVRFYRDGTWIGEDNLEGTPVGATTNVTVATSEDVRARTVLDSLASAETRDTYTYALIVENFKTPGGPIDVRASFSVPTFRTNVLETVPPADETAGGAVVWNTSIASGDKATFRVTYEQLRNR